MSEDKKNSFHHYSLNIELSEIGTQFADVRFVLIAGSAQRVKNHADYLVRVLAKPGGCLAGQSILQLTKNTSRFCLLKLGPILLSDHGMGSASMSIAIHELCLMCKQASVLDKITMIRFGTCGGLGVEPGTLCITNRALDPLLQDFIELKVCGQLVKRSCTMDHQTANLLHSLVSENKDKLDKSDENCLVSDLDSLGGPFEVKLGGTVASNDFYEEQGRTNGAICDHTTADKVAFLERAAQAGVINMEMESNWLAAMCHKLGVSFGVICVSLANRLINDSVHIEPEQMEMFERRLFWANALLIRNKLNSISTN